MGSCKQYAEPATYEDKLEKVMTRMNVEEFNYDWSRFECWVEFYYKGQLYRFEHSVENAKAHGSNIKYGSDVFAQVVLALEDIARITERGIYELQTWISGLKALPKPKEIDECFILLGFTEIPTPKELRDRYNSLVKVAHPDVGGSAEYFKRVHEAKKRAEEILGSATAAWTDTGDQ